MKKVVAVIATSVAANVVCAQTSVSLYGVADAGVEYINNWGKMGTVSHG